jgi:hypothetical protein
MLTYATVNIKKMQFTVMNIGVYFLFVSIKIKKNKQDRNLFSDRKVAGMKQGKQTL